jgi:hypothetical protein
LLYDAASHASRQHKNPLDTDAVTLPAPSPHLINNSIFSAPVFVLPAWFPREKIAAKMTPIFGYISLCGNRM